MTSDNYFRGPTGTRYRYAEIAERIRREAPHTLGKHIYVQLEAIGLLAAMMNGTTPCGLPFTFADAAEMAFSTKLLASLEALLPYAESEAYSPEKLKDSPEAEAEAERAWKAVEAAQAIVAQANGARILPEAVSKLVRFEFTHEPEENPDRAFVLVDDKFDVAIIRTDEGVVIDVYPRHGIDVIASTYAFDTDAEPDAGQPAEA
jgi:hypothetical protein